MTLNDIEIEKAGFELLFLQLVLTAMRITIANCTIITKDRPE